MDLISRQEAIDAMAELQGRASAKGVLIGIHRAWEAIKKLPAAQPEIVHCKDCKHWIPYDWMFSEIWESQNMDDYPEDEISCAYCDMTMKADDYCSRADRKTNERSD